MASRTESSIGEDDESEYSEYSSTVASRSTLADLLSRFTIDVQPECTLKLRSTHGPFVVGADLTHITGTKSNLGALVLKPSNPESQPWRRLRVDNSGTATLRSRKLRWWLLTLDATAHANPLQRTFDVSYRVATKWDSAARGEYHNKRRLALGAGAEARAHWSVAYCLPAIEGSMGTAAVSGSAPSARLPRVAREVHTDVGYAHLDVPRLELVLSWPQKPTAAPQQRSSSSGGGNDSSGPSAADDLENGGGEGGEQDGAARAAGTGAAGVVVPGSGGGHTAPREYLPDYPRAADSSAGGSGRGRQRSSGGSRLQQQLESHVACLSGRWWQTFGRDDDAAC